MMKKKKWMIAAAVVILAAAAGIWFFYGRSNSSDGEVAYVQKISGMNQMTIASRYSGVVESQQTVDYKQDSGRTIDSVMVKTGQNVTVGMPLFRYSVTDAQNKIASSQLEIENYNNQISILSSSGNTTEIQLQIRQLQYQIAAAQQEIAGWQQEVSNAEVTSTIDGVVKSVNENGIGADGSEAPVVTVTKTGEFRIKGKVSEQTVSMFYAGMDVFVRSRTDETKTWKGTVSSVESEPEQNTSEYYYSSGESSSKYPFYVTLEDTAGLMLGQHVYIEPDVGQSMAKEGVWLDMSFLAYEDDGSAYVWKGVSGKLKKQAVTPGETDTETFQIQILEGLNEDDLIAWPDETYHEGMKAVNMSEEGN